MTGNLLPRCAATKLITSMANPDIQPFPKQQILDPSKLKEFANHNFNFNENERKFSKRVENSVGKGEIAYYKQFLLFPPCFQKTCTADTLKPGLVWEWVEKIPVHCQVMNFLTLYHTIPSFNKSIKEAF